MRAPLLARLLAAIADFCCDVWYTFRPNINEFWDTVAWQYRTLPTLTDLAPAFRLPLLLVCTVCDAHVGAQCVTADGHITGPHKARREADVILAGVS